MRWPASERFYIALLVGIALGIAAAFGFTAHAAPRQQETEVVVYDIVRVACQLPEGCDLTVQTEGNRRPLTLRCRDGCVVMARDSVIAQTTLRTIVFEALPDTGSGQP